MTLFTFYSLIAYAQVVWLKVELCRLLEEKRSATLRFVLYGNIFFFIFLATPATFMWLILYSEDDMALVI